MFANLRRRHVPSLYSVENLLQLMLMLFQRLHEAFPAGQRGHLLAHGRSGGEGGGAAKVVFDYPEPFLGMPGVDRGSFHFGD